MPYEFIWATNGEALSLNGLLAPSRYDPLAGRRRAAAQQLNSRWQMGEGSRAAQAAGPGKSEGGGAAADDIYFPNQSNDEAAAVQSGFDSQLMQA